MKKTLILIALVTCIAVLSKGQAGPQPAIVHYVALLTQNDEGAPIPNVQENTIGDIVWSRNNVGDYRGTLAGAFPEDQTVGFIGDSAFSLGGGDDRYTLVRVDDNHIAVMDIEQTPQDGNLDGCPVSITVYPKQ